MPHRQTNIGTELLSGSTFKIWSVMRQDLWEEHDDAKDRADFKRYKVRQREGTAITFLGVTEDGRYVGFLDAELRTDYVEGATSSPIWYIEGIYVGPEERGSGVGSQLVQTLETHARAQGYSEIASDCELTDGGSEAFHKAVGFQEAIRSIHLIKRIVQES